MWHRGDDDGFEEGTNAIDAQSMVDRNVYFQRIGLEVWIVWLFY